MDPLAEKYYYRWRDCVARSRYLEWKEIQDELEAEAEFAMNNDIETEFWCWACKHSECDRHKQTYKKYTQNTNFQKSKGCVGKTQRGRDCHFSPVKNKNYCKYHC